jgi:hypothetical protein
VLKEREPRFAAVRERLARGGGSGGGVLVPGVTPAMADVPTSPLIPGQVLAADGAPRTGAPITARARKKGRRR